MIASRHTVTTVSCLMCAAAIFLVAFSPWAQNMVAGRTVDAIASVDPTGLVKSTTVNVGEVVRLFGSRSRGETPLEFTWYLRDGNVSHNPDTDWSYARAGSYEVGLAVRDGSGRMDIDLVRVDVRLPIAGIDFQGANAGPDRITIEDERIVFDGRPSWPPVADKSHLLFEWDFGDGSALGVGGVVDHAYANAGAYVVRLKVTAPATGAFDVDSSLVTVHNVAPVADPGPASLNASEDDLVTFSALGTADTPSDLVDLAYAWEFGDGSRGHGAVTNHTYARAGTYVVGLTLTDDNDAPSSDVLSVHISNRFPVADAGVDATIPEGRPAFFNGRGSWDTRSDLPTLGYVWTIDPASPGPTATLAGWGPSHAWWDDGGPEDAVHQVGLRITDDDGARSDMDFVDVTVVNVPPLASITGIWWFAEGILFEGYAYDPGSDDLLFVWENGGVEFGRFALEARGQHPRESYAYALLPHNPTGTHVSRTVSLFVHDDDGGSAFTSVELVLAKGSRPPRPACAVPPTVPPNCLLPEPDHETVDNLAPRVDAGPDLFATEDLPQFFIPESWDLDSEEFALFWDFGDGETALQEHVTNPSMAWVSHAFRKAGTYTVSVTVADDDGDSTSNARSVTVENLAPVATLRLPTEVQEDENATVWGGGSVDTPSDLSALLYQWTFSDGASVAGAVGNHVFTQDGRASVRLTVLDDNGASSQAFADIDVDNVAPFAAARGPAQVLEGRSILLDADGSRDTPSDLPLLAYAWRHMGRDIATGRNPVLASSQTGIVDFELRVRDDRGLLGGTSISVRVDNEPPQVHAGPDLTVYGASRPIELTGYAYDAGGAISSTTWRFSDGGTSTGLTVSHIFISSGIHTVCLEISDGSTTALDCATVEVNLDTDGDNLLDEAERILGTKPDGFDTDGDDLTDFHEYMASHTDPTRADTDSDDLSDWEELYVGDDGYTTSPFNPDSDADGLTDGEEARTVRTVTFLGRDRAYEESDLWPGDSFYVERSDGSGSVRRATFDLTNAQRAYRNITGQVEYQVPCLLGPCIVQYETHAKFRWVNLTVDLFTAGFTASDFSFEGRWTFGHHARLSATRARVGVDDGRNILGAQAFLSFSNVEYEEVEQGLLGPFVRFRDNAFFVSELSITVHAKTSPNVPDGDGDGLSDGEELEGWVALTMNDLDSMESFEEAISTQAGPKAILDAFVARSVSSSPIASDPDYDDLPDGLELRYAVDPVRADSDSDGILDGWDVDPSVIDPYGPTISLTDMVTEFGIVDVKTYRLTFRVCDDKGVTGVQSIKNDYMLRVYDLPRPKRCLDFRTSFSIGFFEVFLGAKFYVLAVDETGSLNAISLRQPTLFTDLIDGYMAELTKHYAGPVAGGILGGMYWSLRDAVVDMVELISNFPRVLSALAEVGAALGTDFRGTVWTMLLQILQYLDGNQNASNPYPEGSTDREAFRFFWYFGYVAGSLLLAWTGSRLATAAFKPLRFHRAFVVDGAFDAIADAGALTKKVGLWAKFSPSTRFMLVATSFTAAFALASYVWPEVFQVVFSQFTSVAFPAFVLGSMVNPGGPGGPNPVRRAVVLADGYLNGFIPGPRFFHRTGRGLGDSIMASADIGHKAWRYIRANDDLNVFHLVNPRERIARFFDATPGIPSQEVVRTLLPGGSGYVDNLATLRHGLWDGSYGTGQVYVIGKHIDGTIVKRGADGTPKFNSFFPCGQTIEGNGYTRIVLPPRMTPTQVVDLVGEGLLKGTRVARQGGGWDIQFDVGGRFGVDRMVIEVGDDGIVHSAYPTSGRDVWAWDPGHQNKWRQLFP